MDKADIRTLINSYAYLAPEYGPKLTNHLPMAIHALYEIGASETQIDAFTKDHIRARGLRPLKQKSKTMLTAGNYTNFLGTRDYYFAQDKFFTREISKLGSEETLKRHINTLMHGVCGCAFHGLIRTAYGIWSDNDAEVARGLAYWADTHQSITSVAPTLSSQGASLRDAFALAHQAHQNGDFAHLPHSAPNIFSKIKAVSDTPAFQDLLQNNPLSDQVTLADFRTIALEMYQAQSNFTTLHGLTAIHALSSLYNKAAAQDTLLATMGQAALATYLSVGAPEINDQNKPQTHITDPSELSAAWDVIRNSSNDHAIKLAYSAREEYQATKNTDYLQIIYDIAAPKLP